MKQPINEIKRMQELAGVDEESQKDNSRLSAEEQLSAILWAWTKIGLDAKTSDDHTLGSALYKMLDQLGYQITKK